MQLLQSAKSELLRANADRRHPFRTFALASFGDFPEIRTVVKRQSLADLSTIFFTDSRTPKYEQIRQQPKVSALFYYSRKKLQVRIRGMAHILDPQSAVYQQFYHKIQQSPAVKDYTSKQAPGDPIQAFEQLYFGEKIFFAVVKIIPQELDILQLGDAAHRRALYRPLGPDWEEQMLVP